MGSVKNFLKNILTGNRAICCRHAIVLAAVLFFSSPVFSQNEQYTNGLPGDSLTVGRSLITQDTVFFNSSLKPTIAATKSVNDIVQFSINEFSNKVLPDSFSVTLTCHKL
jgi:hypothetical protein